MEAQYVFTYVHVLRDIKTRQTKVSGDEHVHVYSKKDKRTVLYLYSCGWLANVVGDTGAGESRKIEPTEGTGETADIESTESVTGTGLSTS